MNDEVFQGAVRSSGDVAGVFEHDGETGYFYLYAVHDEQGRRVLDAIHIVSGDADFTEEEVEVRWTLKEDRVGLFIRGSLWAVFEPQGRMKYGGEYRHGGTPAVPRRAADGF